MNEWGSKINGLQLKQILNTKDSDISVNLQAEGSQNGHHSDGICSIVGSGHLFNEIMGETQITPKDGLIDKAQITLARTEFGSPLDHPQLKQIAVLEIGHASGG